jgi:hypothetical protein
MDDAYLVKTDSIGNLLWSKTYGGAGEDICYYVSVCSDSGYILTGASSASNINYDVMLIRTDKNGNLLWQKYFGGSNDDYGWYVLQANDGGFVVTGFTSSFSGTFDGYLIKTDANGNMLWNKTFGGTGTDELYGFNKTNDGGYIVAGETTTNSFGNSDIWLIRLDSIGDTLWTKQYGRSTEDGGNTAIQTSDGGFAVAGDIHSFTTPGAHNAALLKTDSNGNLQWVNVYGSNPGAEISYDMVQNADKGYSLLCNSTVYGAGTKDVMLVTTDSLGNLKWARTYGDSLYEDCWSMQPTGNGYAFAAESRSFTNGQGDIYFVRTDPFGNSGCHDAPVTPGVRNPVMQTRSGITISSGGSVLTHNLTAGNPSTVTIDPCNPQSAGEWNEGVNVSVFPNPAHDILNIETEGFQQGMEFTLYDVCGRKTGSITLDKNKTALDPKNIPAGAYIFMVSENGKIIMRGKIIVQ